MDKVDRKILMQLQQNAKQNTKEIANKVGLSVTPTYERIKKLEKQQIIKSYVALLDRAKIGKQVIAYCQINLEKHKKKMIDNFKDRVIAFPEIMECHYISGNFDFLIKIVTEDMNAYQIFINEKLSAVDGISTIQSSFVMNSVKESTAFIL
jgi:DNA-binding Lrp family transcriptional regulator